MWYFVKLFFKLTSSSNQYPYKIWTSNLGYIDTGFKSCEDRPDFINGELSGVECKCGALFPTQLWSMKKLTWTKKTPEFPPNISMLSGCAVSVNRKKVLFIGGHYTQHRFSSQTWNSDVST